MAVREEATIAVRMIMKGFDRSRNQIREFNKQMTMPVSAMKKMHNQQGQLNKRFKENIPLGQRLALGFRKATHGLRGFRMEMLGVMFFGMGMQKFFTGLLRPVLEVTGVFDIFRAMLQILFLPIGLKLLEWALKVFDFFTGLSQGTKELIGKMVLFGAIIGGALFLFGMFALGIGSVILALGTLFSVIKGVVVGGLIGMLVAQFTGFDVIGGILDNVKNVFGGFIDMIKETELYKKLKEKFGDAFKNMKKVVGSFVEVVAEKLGINKKELKEWWRSVKQIWNKFELKFLLLKQSVTEKLEEWGVDFTDFAGTAGKAFETVFTKLGNAVKDFIEEHEQSLILIAAAMATIAGGPKAGIATLAFLEGGVLRRAVDANIAFNQPKGDRAAAFDLAMRGEKLNLPSNNIQDVNTTITINAATTEEIAMAIGNQVDLTMRERIDEIRRLYERARVDS